MAVLEAPSPAAAGGVVAEEVAVQPEQLEGDWESGEARVPEADFPRPDMDDEAVAVCGI